MQRPIPCQIAAYRHSNGKDLDLPWERTVGLGFLVAIIRRVFGYVPKTIWGGVAVGAVVGLIIALVKGDLDLILLSCAVGLVAGLVFELIISISNRRRTR